MPEDRYTRVRINDTGAHVTVGTVRDGMTVLKQPATDSAGRPLPDEPAPAKQKTSAAKPAAKKTATATAAAPTSGGDAAEVS